MSTRALEETAAGLRWFVEAQSAPARLVFTTRAVRSGRFLEPPAEAWHVERPALFARTAPVRWTVAR